MIHNARMGTCVFIRSTILPLLLFVSLQLPGQTDRSAWRLSGIINLPDLKKAVLQTEKEAAFFAEGEARETPAGRIELVKIDYKKEIIEVYTNALPVTLALNFQKQTNHAETDPTILFERGSLDAVLRLYSDLLGRTLLRHPLLPEPDFTFGVRALNRDDAVRAIENELADKGIALIPDGEIFTMLVPKEIASKIKAAALKNKSPAPKGPRDFEFHFQGVPLVQAADIYAGLFGCELKMDEQFPGDNSITLKLRTVTKLNKDEVIYALDTLFTWAGVKIVPAGQHLMKVVPVARTE
jgi:hypothetical protein